MQHYVTFLPVGGIERQGRQVRDRPKVPKVEYSGNIWAFKAGEPDKVLPMFMMLH